MSRTLGTRRSVPISALEHYEYCPRQAALIHIDGYFDSNVDTVRGDLAHTTVDSGRTSRDRSNARVSYALPVWNEELGIHGVCDAVHFTIEGPTPVEHKVGRYQPGGPADVQVAAQVMCLREMFNAPVPVGVVFTGRDRRRHDVEVDHALATRVTAAVIETRRMLDTGHIPAAVPAPKCRRCSLRPGCIPDAPTRVQHTLFQPREPGNWDE